MNWFDDIRTAELQTECSHLWILKEDGTIYCYDCGKTKKEVSK